MKFHIYKDKKKEFRWKIINKGRIMADSGEGYKTKAGLLKSIQSLKAKIPSAEIVE